MPAQGRKTGNCTFAQNALQRHGGNYVIEFVCSLPQNGRYIPERGNR